MPESALGVYRLDKELTKDRISTSYRAYDRLRSRTVELRTFAAYEARRAETWARVQNVSSDFIVPILQFGQINGTQFIATTWNPTSDLTTMLRDEAPLPVADALTIIEQLATGLSGGATHGSVTPDAVRVTRNGQVLTARLTDFALQLPPPTSSAHTRRHTDAVALCTLLRGCLRPDASTTAALDELDLRLSAPVGAQAIADVADFAVAAQHALSGSARSTLGAGHGGLTRQWRNGNKQISRTSWFTARTAPSKVTTAWHGWSQPHSRAVMPSPTDAGNVTFSATDLVVTSKEGKKLLDGISFQLPGGRLLGVAGPSGAGKSTLLRALTGARPADSGMVQYAGLDLYHNYDELRQRIGLVPQDDILHQQLTVNTALDYAARLRFPASTSGADRNNRINEVLTELGLRSLGAQRISTLSGGQRKRVSVALELLTRPSLLFLDEPASGLDPGLAKSVMDNLRMLADDGRTVIVVTHDEHALAGCDYLLILARGGQLAYFGPPQDVLRYFGQRDYPNLFLMLDNSPGVDWGARFRASPEAARYLTPLPATSGNSSSRPPARPPVQQSALSQLGILCLRYLAVIGADRQYAALLVALPLILSAVAQVLPGSSGLSMDRAQQPGATGSPQQLLLILILGAGFAGFAGAYRELVKERPIYLREQAIGLSRGAYLGSKLAVLGVITLIQAIIIGIVGTIGKPAPPHPLILGSGRIEITVAIAGVALSLMVLGLLVSALIDNENRGMPILVVIFLLQIVLCGALFPLRGAVGLEELAWVTPARWAFAMGAITSRLPPPTDSAALDSVGVTRLVDPLWSQGGGTWALDLVALIALTVAFGSATAFALRRLEPRRR
jgi:ABC-type multidrug transport system ATPase subunit